MKLPMCGPLGPQSLELLNAESKRTATSGGAKRLTLSSEGQQRRPMRGTNEGPVQLITTKGYSTTLAISTLSKLLGNQYLRRGDGIVATPASRRKEGLFVGGRLSLGSTGIKLENLGASYDPKRLETCIKAFVRLLAWLASALPSL